MTRFEEILRARLGADEPSVHLDAEQLAAFAENALNRLERRSVLRHLAACSECRNCLFLITGDQPSARRGPWTWRNWIWIPATAALSLALLLVLLPRETEPIAKVAPKPFTPPSPAPATRTAKVIMPVPPSLPPAPLPSPPLSGPTLSARPDIAVRPLFTTASRFLSASTLVRLPATLWSVSSDSKPALIQRSFDGGRSWEPVHVDDDVTFQAVAAVGPEVWAGGSGGALYRSTDNGRHWSRVPVADKAGVLTETITSLSAAPDVQLRTATGEVWISSDGGRHWSR